MPLQRSGAAAMSARGSSARDARAALRADDADAADAHAASAIASAQQCDIWRIYAYALAMPMFARMSPRGFSRRASAYAAAMFVEKEQHAAWRQRSATLRRALAAQLL